MGVTRCDKLIIKGFPREEQHWHKSVSTHKTSSERDNECFVTRQEILLGITNTFVEEYTKPRDEVRCQTEMCFAQKNTRIGNIHHLLVTREYGRCGTDVLIGLMANDGSKPLGCHQQGCWQLRHGMIDGVYAMDARLYQCWRDCSMEHGETRGRHGTRRPLKRSTSQQPG